MLQNDVHLYESLLYFLHVSYSQISSDNKNTAKFHLLLGAIDNKIYH